LGEVSETEGVGRIKQHKHFFFGACGGHKNAGGNGVEIIYRLINQRI